MHLLRFQTQILSSVLVWVLGFGLMACTSSKQTYNEKPGQLPHPTLQTGIPAYGATTLTYQKNGRRFLRITLDSAVAAGVADKPYGWGFFQFPQIGRTGKGDLIAKWHLAEDNIKDYGKGSYGYARSADNGRHWQRIDAVTEPFGGLIAPNGDRIEVYTPKPINVQDLKLPPPVDSAREAYQLDKKHILYRTSQLPDTVNGIYLNRVRKGTHVWVRERAKLLDNNSLRYSLNGLVPVVWWGQMQRMDNNIYTCTYPGFRLQANGKATQQQGIDCYTSPDNGHTWSFQGYIPYVPDQRLDAKANQRFGFTEPAFAPLANGDFVSVMRTTDGQGHGPLYVSHSTDRGRTWTTPRVIRAAGVLPKLLMLQNGVLVLSTGRPGVQLLFSKDGGHSWTESFELLNVPLVDEWRYTCGYTDLVPISRNAFLVIYSDFKYKTAQGDERKVIYTRRVEVK